MYWVDSVCESIIGTSNESVSQGWMMSCSGHLEWYFIDFPQWDVTNGIIIFEWETLTVPHHFLESSLTKEDHRLQMPLQLWTQLDK